MFVGLRFKVILFGGLEFGVRCFSVFWGWGQGYNVLGFRVQGYIAFWGLGSWLVFLGLGSE